ncbi:hypothetical protein F511_10684 [Dorcoceras hygrometricum]|uniref:Uncharacterized protein n=1 Tax=Dorcoceras hygrometricum TaxID=472368 RepID=A0A2Z7CN11_9LAMI|nr:hypothetical protein F511_10684 [Dorcoceras hygrometricum]
MLTIVLDKDLECIIVYVRCDSGYDGYHETHLIVTVYSELFLVDWAVKMRIRPPELETSICDVKYHVSLIAVYYRQSGPRPDPRLLHQAALEALTRSAQTDSPRRTGQKQFSGGGGGAWEAAAAAAYSREGGGVGA